MELNKYYRVYSNGGDIGIVKVISIADMVVDLEIVGTNMPVHMNINRFRDDVSSGNLVEVSELELVGIGLRSE